MWNTRETRVERTFFTPLIAPRIDNGKRKAWTKAPDNIAHRVPITKASLGFEKKLPNILPSENCKGYIVLRVSDESFCRLTKKAFVNAQRFSWWAWKLILSLLRDEYQIFFMQLLLKELIKFFNITSLIFITNCQFT